MFYKGEFQNQISYTETHRISKKENVIYVYPTSQNELIDIMYEIRSWEQVAKWNECWTQDQKIWGAIPIAGHVLYAGHA